MREGAHGAVERERARKRERKRERGGERDRATLALPSLSLPRSRARALCLSLTNAHTMTLVTRCGKRETDMRRRSVTTLAGTSLPLTARDRGRGGPGGGD